MTGLFQADPRVNLLPGDGEVYDFGIIFPDREENQDLFARMFRAIPWEYDRGALRKTCLVGESGLRYRYPGGDHWALHWPPFLVPVRARVEAVTGARFNTCLLNLYTGGEAGLGWHADDEPELGPEPTIASLSFGATRYFAFRHENGRRRLSMDLHDGQLVVMAGATQRHWKHSLPTAPKVTEPRINLTFRSILNR